MSSLIKASLPPFHSASPQKNDACAHSSAFPPASRHVFRSCHFLRGFPAMKFKFKFTWGRKQYHRGSAVSFLNIYNVELTLRSSGFNSHRSAQSTPNRFKTRDILSRYGDPHSLSFFSILGKSKGSAVWGPMKLGESKGRRLVWGPLQPLQGRPQPVWPHLKVNRQTQLVCCCYI